MKDVRNSSTFWLAIMLGAAMLSGCVSGTSTLVDRCAASDDGVPTQEEIDACAALERHPEMDERTLISLRHRQAMALFELGEYQESLAIHQSIPMTSDIPASVLYSRAQTELALGNVAEARHYAESGMDHDGRVLRMLYDLHEKGELGALADDPFFEEFFRSTRPGVVDPMDELLFATYETRVPQDIRIKLRQRALTYVGLYDGPIDGMDSGAMQESVESCIVDTCWESFGPDM